mgnify:CR=1 FL=1
MAVRVTTKLAMKIYLVVLAALICACGDESGNPLRTEDLDDAALRSASRFGSDDEFFVRGKLKNGEVIMTGWAKINFTSTN